LMAQILELSKFAENNSVAKVDIGGGWIHTQFHAQRPTEREFLTQFLLVNDLRSASL
jgi:hypothetical protein